VAKSAAESKFFNPQSPLRRYRLPLAALLRFFQSELWEGSFQHSQLLSVTGDDHGRLELQGEQRLDAHDRSVHREQSELFAR
jgi:hypothetical protein